MINIKNHRQQPIFDSWLHLGPKHRKLLDESWAGLFQREILQELPVHKLACYFDSGFGRPTKEIYTSLGVLLFQQMNDLTDEEAFQQTLWTLRSILTENSLDADIFDAVRDKLAKVFKVNTDNQRIDSVHIKSNMRRLGRIGIFVSGISKFLRNLKRNHRGRFDTIEKDLKIKYLSKKGKRSFSMIKPSDSHKTLSEVSNDLYGLVEQFKDCSDVSGIDSYKLLVRILNEQCNVTDTGQGPQVEVKKPKEIPSDSLYGGDDNCQAAKELEVAVLSPIMGRKKDEDDNLSDFQFNETGDVVRCPSGNSPVKTHGKKSRHSACFKKGHCSKCDKRKVCPVKEGEKFYYLRYTDKELRVALRRSYEKTGVKQLRVRGLGNVRFSAVLKAAGVNIFRATAVRKAIIVADIKIFAKNYIFSVVKERVFRIYDYVRKFLSYSGKIYDCEYVF